MLLLRGDAVAEGIELLHGAVQDRVQEPHDRHGLRRGQHGLTGVSQRKPLGMAAEQLCTEAGVHVRLHTRVVAAVKDGENPFNIDMRP